MSIPICVSYNINTLGQISLYHRSDRIIFRVSLDIRTDPVVWDKDVLSVRPCARL